MLHTILTLRAGSEVKYLQQGRGEGAGKTGQYISLGWESTSALQSLAERIEITWQTMVWASSSESESEREEKRVLLLTPPDLPLTMLYILKHLPRNKLK